MDLNEEGLHSHGHVIFLSKVAVGMNSMSLWGQPLAQLTKTSELMSTGEGLTSHNR